MSGIDPGAVAFFGGWALILTAGTIADLWFAATWLHRRYARRHL